MVKNLIFLKPTTWERTRTSPWEKEEIKEVEEVKEVKDGEDAKVGELRLVAAISRGRTWVRRTASV